MALFPPYQFLADAVLALHFGIVAFVIGALVLIVAGNLRSWPWVNAPWFRLVHLAFIAAVVAESWFELTCPMTSLEMWLRTKAGVSTYGVSFIEYWLQRALYYEAPPWVFTLSYSIFGLLVVATWWYFPPGFKRRAERSQA